MGFDDEVDQLKRELQTPKMDAAGRKAATESLLAKLKEQIQSSGWNSPLAMGPSRRSPSRTRRARKSWPPSSSTRMAASPSSPQSARSRPATIWRMRAIFLPMSNITTRRNSSKKLRKCSSRALPNSSLISKTTRNVLVAGSGPPRLAYLSPMASNSATPGGSSQAAHGRLSVAFLPPQRNPA